MFFHINERTVNDARVEAIGASQNMSVLFLLLAKA